MACIARVAADSASPHGVGRAAAEPGRLLRVVGRLVTRLLLLSLLLLGAPLSLNVALAEEGASAKPAREYSSSEKRASRKFARQLVEYKYLSAGERKRYLRNNPDFARTLKRKKGALERLQQSLVVQPSASGGADEGAAEESVDEDEPEEEAAEGDEEGEDAGGEDEESIDEGGEEMV
jgi:hypothetical protein